MEQAVAIGIWWIETIAKLGTAPQQRFAQPELSAELYLSGKWDLLPAVDSVVLYSHSDWSALAECSYSVS